VRKTAPPHLAVVGEWRPFSAIGPRRLVLADQSRLRDANRRDRGEKTDVAGKAEAARVRQALAVDKQKIRPHPQALQRCQGGRRLAQR